MSEAGPNDFFAQINDLAGEVNAPFDRIHAIISSAERLGGISAVEQLLIGKGLPKKAGPKRAKWWSENKELIKDLGNGTSDLKL